jgi:hypothetical protein
MALPSREVVAVARLGQGVLRTASTLADAVRKIDLPG